VFSPFCKIFVNVKTYALSVAKKHRAVASPGSPGKNFIALGDKNSLGRGVEQNLPESFVTARIWPLVKGVSLKNKNKRSSHNLSARIISDLLNMTASERCVFKQKLNLHKFRPNWQIECPNNFILENLFHWRAANLILLPNLFPVFYSYGFILK